MTSPALAVCHPAFAQGGEFGFVVFAAAHTAGVLSGEWTALLNMVVALNGDHATATDAARLVDCARRMRRR
ncbi:hypothetical protein [Propionivibrio sp.]|uniref:hypothetical protein n=1 Tax=Propionivibrio sp. TaxID=2212460 RepID=UPI0025DFEBC4|nr:hypothetical protein [Propionivibrio sp.]